MKSRPCEFAGWSVSFPTSPSRDLTCPLTCASEVSEAILDGAARGAESALGGVSGSSRRTNSHAGRVA